MPHVVRTALRAALVATVALQPLVAQSAGGIDPRATQSLRFRNVGPFRGGRVTTVAGVPQRKLEFYLGASGGGIWKTTDAGNHWNNVSDGFLSTGSIGAIRVAPSNPDIVWVGTGSDGIRSNVIVGRGVYRTTDAGKSWKFLGLRNIGQVGAMVVHPTNPDVAFVAAQGLPFSNSKERGVYRTKDGGTSWEQVLFVNDSTGITDIVAKPDDPNTLYAAAWRGVRHPWAIVSGSRDDGGKGATGIGALPHRFVLHPHHVRIDGIGIDVRVVERSQQQCIHAGDLRPRLTRVIRAIHASLRLLRLHQYIDATR